MSQTSLLSTALKFIDVTDSACALIISEDCQMSWFQKSELFSTFIDMDSKILSPYTLAYEASQGLTPPDKFETVKADNWLSGKRIKPSTEIPEWTLPVNSYGQIFTLLLDEEGIGGWVEEDYDDENEEVEWEPPTFHKSKRKK